MEHFIASQNPGGGWVFSDILRIPGPLDMILRLRRFCRTKNSVATVSVQHPPVVGPRRPARLVRQHRE